MTIPRADNSLTKCPNSGIVTSNIVNIGLISDTHIIDEARASRFGLSLYTTVFPVQIKDAFRGVDLILHAGDIYDIQTLDELERIAPVLAAEGDDDPSDVVKDKRVKRRHILTIEGLTIGLAHQHQTWYWEKPEKPLNVIIFGHTHSSSLHNYGDVLQINPGSANFPHYDRRLGSVGLLTINSGKAEAQIIQLK